MATGTQKAIGFLMASQRPLDEHYLNEGTDWADEAAVLAGIPLGSRSSGKQVMIAGVLYKFKSNLTELETVYSSSAPTASDVSIADAAEIYESTNVEDALQEVMSDLITLEAAVGNLDGTRTTFRIDLNTASKVVATRVAGATETTDYPTGWTLAANSVYDLLVTHTLTGRKLSSINIFEIDGDDERLLPGFGAAYSGVVCNGLTVLIEGLAPVDLAIRIELIFS